MKNLILASSSPRRKELLAKLQIPFDVQPTNTDESYQEGLAPSAIVEELALRKAKAAQPLHPEAFIIGSDTIVVYGETVMGKPQSREHAETMLKQLSGSMHEVYTGAAVLHQQKKEVFHVKTEVLFWELDEQLIKRYLDSGEPFDKAGAYGIQGLGSLFVKEIKGDYFSVVGLPVSPLFRVLQKMGLTPPAP